MYEITPFAAQRYKEMLTHVSAVTRNESSDSVNGILDTVSVSEDLRMVRTRKKRWGGRGGLVLLEQRFALADMKKGVLISDLSFSLFSLEKTLKERWE